MSPTKAVSTLAARAVLLIAAAVFALMAAGWIGDPTATATRDQIALNGPFAVTALQSALGGITAGLAIFCLICAVTRQGLRSGLGLVALVCLSSFVLRLWGVGLRGDLIANLPRLFGEAVIGALALAGLAAELWRARRPALHPPAAAAPAAPPPAAGG